jgi:hypothetical protein
VPPSVFIMSHAVRLSTHTQSSFSEKACMIPYLVGTLLPQVRCCPAVAGLESGCSQPSAYSEKHWWPSHCFRFYSASAHSLQRHTGALPLRNFGVGYERGSFCVRGWEELPTLARWELKLILGSRRKGPRTSIFWLR